MIVLKLASNKVYGWHNKQKSMKQTLKTGVVHLLKARNVKFDFAEL